MAPTILAPLVLTEMNLDNVVLIMSDAAGKTKLTQNFIPPSSDGAKVMPEKV